MKSASHSSPPTGSYSPSSHHSARVSGDRLPDELREQAGRHVQSITAIYWSLSVPALDGILGQIRTKLVRLPAEMRAAISTEAKVPGADAADHTVSVVVHSNTGSTIKVKTAQPS